jgi:hypothetical protein
LPEKPVIPPNGAKAGAVHLLIKSYSFIPIVPADADLINQKSALHLINGFLNPGAAH